MVYYDLPGLLPNEKGPNSFQLYFIETENEVENRMRILENSSICEATVQKLLRVLLGNPYAKIFRRLKDYPSVKDIQLHISKDVKLDQRVYNSPAADQVAAIWVEGNDGDIPFERDIIVHSHSGDRHRIKHYYGCYDPLQYPILFSRVDNPNHGDVPTITSFSSANDVLSKENEDVRLLWDTYFDAMSEDFKRETTISVELRVSKTLQSLNLFLESMGKSISLYDLPTRPTNMDNVDCEFPREIQDEISIQIPPEDYEAELKLNLEQHKSLSMTVDVIQKGKSGIFFIDDPGRTRKIFLYRALLAHLRSKNLIAIATATATSGVAAAIMPGGRTTHSRFKISIDANKSSECTMSKQSGAAELLRRSKLFTWDEAPVAKRWAIENVDKLLKDVMGNDQDFGGKVVVFGGDFRQVLPVVPKATIHQTISQRRKNIQ
ncbi:UNVERIFIED_CONTAM: hypothetical protein Sangu_3152400 [Sesamum angustifolium]|uniref:ATP-dependent DNA helicase n=1 Tax=Sesamum angustifolium TaxID=2727405 RepID=A0AAW2JUF1_9LAMI